MDHSPLGFFVHEIFQGRILKWIPFPSPGELLVPGIKPTSPSLADWFFYHWARRETRKLDPRQFNHSNQVTIYYLVNNSIQQLCSTLLAKLFENILAHLTWKKRPDSGEDWGREERSGDRGQDGWMASLTQWTEVWADSRRWWRTGKPGVLQSMRLQSRTGLRGWTTKTTWKDRKVS